MGRYLLKRLIGVIPTLLAVIFLTFVLLRLAPGGPFDSERALPPDIEANINKAYQLDNSLPKQFIDYTGRILQGDLGPSFRYRDFTVNEIIAEALPISLSLGLFAMLLAVTAGLLAGLMAALHHHRWQDRLVSFFAISGISLPTIVIAPLLIYAFAVQLDLLPAAYSSDQSVLRFLLPILALALPQLAYVARISRAGFISALNSDFVRTARAQGLCESRIIRVHALPAVLLPLVSYLGPALAATLAGSIVVESVFGIPGIGLFFINAAMSRDYTLVMGITLVVAIMVITLNLLTDMLYPLIDPRIRKPG